MPADRYCESVIVSPLRARSKILAARSRAAGGRLPGSVGGAEDVLAEPAAGGVEVAVGGGTVVCVEGGREITAGCGPVGSIGVGCCCCCSEDVEDGRLIGMGIVKVRWLERPCVSGA